MGLFDQGAEGRYREIVMDSGALENLRDILGMPPSLGKEWAMVNVRTGQAKWYKSGRRTFRRSYRRK